jgi:hypothetical protein
MELIMVEVIIFLLMFVAVSAIVINFSIGKAIGKIADKNSK